MDWFYVDFGKGGDGWFGLVIEVNVIVFQFVNGLKLIGVVDWVIWIMLFLLGVKYFDVQVVQELFKWWC